MAPNLNIRPMQIRDIPAGMALKRQAGWNQTEADWLRFLSLNPQGCFVGHLNDRVMATATTTVFGPVGWIAMVLVDVEHRGQGFAKAILNHAVTHLSSRVETIKLDATELGQPLYDRLGFRGEYKLTRYELDAIQTNQNDCAAAPLPIDDALLAFDTAVYGADRSPLLRALSDEGHPAIVARDAGRVTGYAVIRPGNQAAFFGPAIAANEDAYSRIVDWLRATVRGPTYLDVPHSSRFRDRIQNACGLKRQRDFLRMYRGQSPFAGQPAAVIATSGSEKG
jgi:ribosomal protein S18 acetylase RimI-like enzyme